MNLETLEVSIKALSLLSIGTNSYCLYYSINTFDCRQSLNFIMSFDAGLAVFSSLLILITSIVSEVSAWKCEIEFFGMQIIPQLFCVYLFISAYIR